MGAYMGGGGRLYGLTCQLLERLSPLKIHVVEKNEKLFIFIKGYCIINNFPTLL